MSKTFIEIRRNQLKQIKEIIEDQKSMSQSNLEEKYKEFAEKNPKTWINILDKSFSVHHLERNVELYEQFYTRSSGDHANRKFEADVGFGEHLAKEYLYPHTGQPSQESKNVALGIARKKNESVEYTS